MTTLQIYLFIVAPMYGALIGYSAYHLFFSKQPVFDNKFKLKNLMGRKKHERATIPGIKPLTVNDLQQKLEALKMEHNNLLTDVMVDYSPDKIRAINVIENKIEATRQRIEGNWTDPGTRSASVLTRMATKSFSIN